MLEQIACTHTLLRHCHRWYLGGSDPLLLVFGKCIRVNLKVTLFSNMIIKGAVKKRSV